MSVSRPQNIIGGARIVPTSTYAGGVWNLGEVGFYKSYYEVNYGTSYSKYPWPTNMITRGLIGYWDANNTASYPGTGTTWSDLSGNGYTGTLTNGPTYTSNNGGGIVLDGVNDYVTTTYTAAIGNNFTVAAWCYPTAVGQSVGSEVVHKAYSATTNSFGIDYLSTSKFRFGTINNTTGSTVTGATTCSINNFYYVALSFGGDASDKTIRGYINYQNNMINDALLTNANNPSFNASYAVNFGTFVPSPANNYWTGNIYAVQLYNVSLTENEIQTNFDAMRGRFGI